MRASSTTSESEAASAGCLAVLVLVQPWLVWPGLFPATSHRLTLVCCCAALGLVRMLRGGWRHGLPELWGWWAGLMLGVLIVHGARVIGSGNYFRFFQETALFSDGMIALLAFVWGAWALLQLPARLLRGVRWLALALLLANVPVAAANWMRMEWEGIPAHLNQVSGVFGLDRTLATWSLAWLPVCWAWRRWLAVIPLALIAWAGKPLPLLAVGVLAAAWAWGRFPRWRFALVAHAWLAVVVAAVLTPEIGLKLFQRAQAWVVAWQAAWERPLAGWGFSPLVPSQISQRYGALLPSWSSDWLALAVSAGWAVTGVAAWALWRTLRGPARSRWASACRASLCALAGLSLVQETVSRAAIAGAALVLMTWFTVEQRTGEAGCGSA